MFIKAHNIAHYTYYDVQKTGKYILPARTIFVFMYYILYMCLTSPKGKDYKLSFLIFC